MRNCLANFHEIRHLSCMYSRVIDLTTIIEKKSFFLLGPRQTGKSTLLQAQFPDATYIDLLAADVYRQLSAYPERLREQLIGDERLVIIDEIQKLPSLLDEVQLLITKNKDVRFILTGSSARKLRRGGANLLAGRAWTRYLHPLVYAELPNEKFRQRLLHGSLPHVIDSHDPIQELKEYCGVYLQEEIRAESLTRSIEAFSRFLSVAALCNGEQLNYTKIGNDSQVPPRTVREFFVVLEDTLVGFNLPAFRSGRSRKAVASSKFYFFDIGVAHSLQGITQLAEGSTQYGKALEHLIAMELRAYCSYRRPDAKLSYWRSTSQIEVDFVIDSHIAIEVKATGNVSHRDSKGLIAFAEEAELSRSIIVSTEKHRRRLESGVEVWPVEEFLALLWSGGLY
jgi:uncharacterized protein